MLRGGGSVTVDRYNRQNGYVGNPQIVASQACLRGLRLSYDNSAVESAATGNVVRATISASANGAVDAESNIW